MHPTGPVNTKLQWVGKRKHNAPLHGRYHDFHLQLYHDTSVMDAFCTVEGLKGGLEQSVAPVHRFDPGGHVGSNHGVTNHEKIAICDSMSIRALSVILTVALSL